MKVSRALLIVDALCVGLLLYLYGQDVSDYLRAQRAHVSAMSELPRLWFAIPVLVGALVAGGMVLHGLRGRRDGDYRGFRIPPIVLVVVLFVDVLVLSQQRIPISTADQSAIALHLAAQVLTPLVGPEGVPTDPNIVASVVRGMGPPPFLVRGKLLDHFAVQVRTDCIEPIGEAPGAAPATFIYCASRDRRIAWITLVGLPAEKRFGEPEVFSKDGVVQITTVVQRPPDEEVPGSSPNEPSEGPEGGPTR